MVRLESGSIRMGQQNVPYSRRAQFQSAAEYYASIRKPESAWKAIEDLASQYGMDGLFGHESSNSTFPILTAC